LRNDSLDNHISPFCDNFVIDGSHGLLEFYWKKSEESKVTQFKDQPSAERWLQSMFSMKIEEEARLSVTRLRNTRLLVLLSDETERSENRRHEYKKTDQHCIIHVYLLHQWLTRFRVTNHLPRAGKFRRGVQSANCASVEFRVTETDKLIEHTLFHLLR
jgi:hypothetical protein